MGSTINVKTSATNVTIKSDNYIVGGVQSFSNNSTSSSVKVNNNYQTYQNNVSKDTSANSTSKQVSSDGLSANIDKIEYKVPSVISIFDNIIDDKNTGTIKANTENITKQQPKETKSEETKKQEDPKAKEEKKSEDIKEDSRQKSEEKNKETEQKKETEKKKETETKPKEEVKKNNESSGNNSGGKRLTREGGVTYYNGHKETWYSLNEPGQTVTAREIPGKHVDSDGIVRDKDGYVCLAMPLDTATREKYGYSYYQVVETSWGKGKIYDCGTVGNTLDIYTNW